MKRRILKEAPTRDQVVKFTNVLTAMFGDDCQLALRQGHGDTGVIFYSHRDDNFTKVSIPGGAIQDLGNTRPRMFEPLAQGSEQISAALLQNAEMQPAFLPVIKSLFKAAGKAKEFSDKFETSKNAPLSLDEREELVRLRKENEELKKKIAKLQGDAYGIPRGQAATSSATGYKDLEID